MINFIILHFVWVKTLQNLLYLYSATASHVKNVFCIVCDAVTRDVFFKFGTQASFQISISSVVYVKFKWSLKKKEKKHLINKPLLMLVCFTLLPAATQPNHSSKMNPVIADVVSLANGSATQPSASADTTLTG